MRTRYMYMYTRGETRMRRSVASTASGKQTSILGSVVIVAAEVLQHVHATAFHEGVGMVTLGRSSFPLDSANTRSGYRRPDENAQQPGLRWHGDGYTGGPGGSDLSATFNR